MFAILYFNTGLVMMLVGANIPMLSSIFDGAYKDFTSQWFVIIGSVIVLNSLGDLISPPIAHYFNELLF